MSPRLAFTLQAAYEAGRSTLAHFHVGVTYQSKQDASPVTVADLHAEQLIRRAIEAQYPREAMVGEEGGGDHAVADRWIIDPIDGTKSFVAGVPLYGTLLSYEVDYKPVVAAVYFPALDEMVYAELGSGTFWNGRPVRVSSRPAVEGSILCSGGHKSHVTYGRADGLNRAAATALATRTWSDAYGHALVATGRADAMMDPVVARWDISAPRLIVEEAGGKCTRYDGGDPFVLAHQEYELVSSNGLIHEELLGFFR